MSFPKFQKHYKPEAVVKLPESTIDEISQKVSPSFASFLAAQGTARYDDGFLFTVNPLDYLSLTSLRFKDEADVFVLARTSFGDMYLSRKNAVYLYQPSYNKLTEITNDINYLFDVFLLDTSFADDFLFRDIHAPAQKLLGSCTPDECYGFVPALPLGGEANINSLQKVKIREYLSMLIQIEN